MPILTIVGPMGSLFEPGFKLDFRDNHDLHTTNLAA